MKDLHNHLLFGIDDGAKDVEDSVFILREMEKLGYDTIILTPHYIHSSKYAYDNKSKQERLDYLKKYLEEENIKINLYSGNEIFIDSDIHQLILDGKVSPIAGSRYLLIEYSIYHQLSNDMDILMDLINKGYIPILAHPERYVYYQDNFDYYEELVKKGILLQGSIESLHNRYGKKAKKCLQKLLKHNLIHFLATDIHSKEDLIYLNKLDKILDKYINKDQKEMLMKTNVSKVIDNLEIIN